MTDIDTLLGRVRTAPVHPGLATMDGAVLDALATRSAAGAPFSSMTLGLAAVAAMILGVAGSAYPGTPERSAPLAPFGAPAALAPSTLLGDVR
jgi:hypothetical protein